MGTVFEEFRKGSENPPDDARTNASEEHTYIIVRPEPDKPISVSNTVSDHVDDGAYSKRITTAVLECGCCGALTSYDPDSKHKPPAGRCQNTECRVLLCAAHLERQSCCVCGQTLCCACARKAVSDDARVFCAKHFREFAEKRHRREVSECAGKE